MKYNLLQIGQYNDLKITSKFYIEQSSFDMRKRIMINIAKSQSKILIMISAKNLIFMDNITIQIIEKFLR